MTRIYKSKDLRVLTRYDEAYNVDESNAFLRKLALSHLREVTHEAAREYLAPRVASGDLLPVCDFDPPYRELTAADAGHIRQATAFFSKRGDLELGVDREAAAREKFLEAELACKQTNETFRAWSRGAFQFHPDVERILFDAQRIITRILGPVPSLAELKFRFGPGATTLRKKKDAHPRYKLGDAFACSEALLPIAAELLAEFPAWVGLTDEIESVTLPVEIHDGRVQFVPKSWKTHRAIVVEPQLNTVFQLGVGDFIAQRLRLHGVDLRDQSCNQKAARLGSLTGALATLDLSSASDTISRELVAHLLPLDWYSFLCFGRSPCVMLGNDRVRQEKFSSMGNGFTFPLESLIFYALASASCEGHAERSEVLVYGDDIIVPSHRYPRLVRALVAVGFTVNLKKSFYFGSFRESCGADYLTGRDIRPYYQKSSVSCADLFLLHNHYVRKGDYARALFVLKFIAKPVRVFGPDGYGDGHLLGEGGLTPHRREAGWGGYTFDTYVQAARGTTTVSRGDYVWPAYTIYARHSLRPDREVRLGVSAYDRWWSSLRAVALSTRALPDSVCSLRNGKTRVTLPGTAGYKRISIYTF